MRSYHTHKYILTLVTSIIDRLMFFVGFYILYKAYLFSYALINGFNDLFKAEVSSLESPASVLDESFASFKLQLIHLIDATSIGTVYVAAAIVVVGLIIHLLYMLPLIIVSHTTLKNARKANFDARSDIMGNDRFKCDAILKLIMHLLAATVFVLIGIVCKTVTLIYLSIPFFVVAVLALVTLNVKEEHLKFNPVEPEPIAEEPISEYIEF